MSVIPQPYSQNLDRIDLDTASQQLNALLPSQTGQTGKVLKTDGSAASWQTDVYSAIAANTILGNNTGSPAPPVALTASQGLSLLGGIDNAALQSALADYYTASATDTLLSGKAASSHTHTLSNLTQSGATANQVPQWNGTAWVPATVSTGGGTWGSITGTLSAQTDLQTALDGKLDTSSLGTGVAAFLTTPSSANLATAVTGETGSGAIVFGTSPTLSIPVINNFRLGYTTTATSAGTLTLSNGSSTHQQFFTGTTTHTVVLPVASTLALGQYYWLTNNSTGVITVNSSGGNLVVAIVPGASVKVTCILASGTTAASWDVGFVGFATVTGTGSGVLSASPTFTGTVNVSGSVLQLGNRALIAATNSSIVRLTDSVANAGFSIDCTTDGLASFRDRANAAAGNIQAGNITATGTINIGSGTSITRVISATATLDFGSVAANSFADLTITVTGAAVGDTVSLGVPNGAILNDISFFGWVSATNTVTVRCSNVSSTTARDPASGTFRATVTRF